MQRQRGKKEGAKSEQGRARGEEGGKEGIFRIVIGAREVISAFKEFQMWASP